MRSHLLLLSVSLTLLACADPLKADEDGDGVTIVDDCDDNDPSLGSVLEDADCDGALTADDCDDEDSSSLVTAEDGDCDGVLTADDCDDNDSNAGPVFKDGDCDGVLKEDDCDDTNANSHLDVDNDGYSTCGGDCDDNDATLDLDDVDGDGYSTCDGDCNDNHAGLEPADLDNDGYSTCDGDCDDNDWALDLDDFDGDGYSTCDGDCDDMDQNSTMAAEDADCDGVLTSDDCDDVDPALGDIASDLDCDGHLSGADCDDTNSEIDDWSHPTCPWSYLTYMSVSSADRWGSFDNFYYDCEGNCSAVFTVTGRNTRTREMLCTSGENKGASSSETVFKYYPYYDYKGSNYSGLHWEGFEDNSSDLIYPSYDVGNTIMPEDPNTYLFLPTNTWATLCVATNFNTGEQRSYAKDIYGRTYQGWSLVGEITFPSSDLSILRSAKYAYWYYSGTDLVTDGIKVYQQ